MTTTKAHLVEALNIISALEVRDAAGALLPVSATIQLFFVWAHEEGVALKVLRAFTRTSGANITCLADRWVRLGYVDRSPDSADRRSYILTALPFLADQFDAE